ncbi:ChuX/HutX family heme-like substrate-binding protein [Flectobacillus sp. DC10W]|uniref:ChuX/HutX family heme-like substrate-binding protein n=1 Tax=Flectobacillus longus TaxID=2984207 RepID=A0ABT6YQ52_9BACT|nr:ChuX/HutX family heme-like substrate-binding protein [Flectobacillus longus]MDI9865584.1 ChuX/HutX family heme-like substrate-binding protein [Flectobacillus longus]
MSSVTLSLKEIYQNFQNENPKVRIRDAAKQLGVSEAELLATSIGEGVVRLSGDFRELMKQIPSLGYVMALTRNESCVHERKGKYEKVSFNNHVGLVLGEDIDLRLFMSHWKFGFAVEAQNKSLQFFDENGNAVHKIFLQESSNVAAYQDIVSNFRDTEQSELLEVIPEIEFMAPPANPDLDVEAFQEAWLKLEDTHQFFPLLQKFGVNRQQALAYAPDGYAQKVSVEQVKQVLEEVSSTNTEIMIFVSSKGCIQIHTGLVQKLVSMGPWFNVLDPQFNLHLREDHIAEAWLVKKPTNDGIVTSLELFDENFQQIALIFGKRKPGKPELEAWRVALEKFIN